MKICNKLKYFIVLFLTFFLLLNFSTLLNSAESNKITITGEGKSIISAKIDCYKKAIKYFIIKITEEGSYNSFKSKIEKYILKNPTRYILDFKIIKKESKNSKVFVTAEVEIDINKLKLDLKKYNIKIKNSISLNNSTGILSKKYLSTESIKTINSLPDELKVALYRYLNNLIISTIPSFSLENKSNKEYISYAISVINDYLSKNSFEYLNYEYYLEILHSLSQYDTDVYGFNKDQLIIDKISQKYGSDIIIMISSLDIKYKKNVNSYNVVVSTIIKTFDSITGRGLGEKPVIVERSGKNLDFTIKSTISYAITRIIDDILERTSSYFIQSFKDGIRYKVKIINNTDNKLTPVKIKFRNIVKSLKKVKSFESKTSSQNEIIYFLYYLGTLDQFEQELFEVIKKDKVFKKFDTLYKIHNAITFIMDNSKIENNSNNNEILKKEKDNLPPKIEIINPKNNSETGQTFTLILKYIDKSDINSISINIDNKGWEDISLSTNFTRSINDIKFNKKTNFIYEIYLSLNKLNLGMHIIKIKAKDSNNNQSNKYSLIIKVKDLEPPFIKITYPENSQKVDNNFTVKANIIDILKIKNIYIKIDNGKWIICKGTAQFTYSFKDIPEGNHLIYIKAKDNFNNESKPEIISLYVTDISPPEINIFNLSNGSNIEIPYFINGKVKDFSGIKNLLIKLDNKKWENIEVKNNSFKYLIENINTGKHTIYFKANDIKNNTSKILTITFKIIKTTNKEFNSGYEIPLHSTINDFKISLNGFLYILYTDKISNNIYNQTTIVNILKLSKNGDKLWHKTFDLKSIFLNSKLYLLNNNLYLIGTEGIKIDHKNKYFIRIIKLSSNGKLLYDKVISIKNIDQIKFLDASIDQESNILILAKSYQKNGTKTINKNIIIKIENDIITNSIQLNTDKLSIIKFNSYRVSNILLGTEKNKLYLLEIDSKLKLLNTIQFRFDYPVYLTDLLSVERKTFITGKIRYSNQNILRSFILLLNSNYDIISLYRVFSSALSVNFFKTEKNVPYLSFIMDNYKIIILNVSSLNTLLKTKAVIYEKSKKFKQNELIILNKENYFYILNKSDIANKKIIDLNIKLIKMPVKKYNYKIHLTKSDNIIFNSNKLLINKGINKDTDGKFYIFKFYTE